MRALLILLLLTAPALAQKPDAAKNELDQLLGALPLAPNQEIAARMESRINAIWRMSGGPAVAMLITRGARDLASGASDEAVADLDAALTLEPDLTEGFARRSVARFHAGDIKGALQDAQEALKREPRHFGVWKALSEIQEARGDMKGALVAWRKLLEVDPKTEGGEERLKELTQKVDGEAL